MRPHAETLYIGERREGRCLVTVAYPNGRKELLPPCNVIRNHSPDGFDWGYLGSGPAQLALALAVHAVGRRIGERIYQRLKERLVNGFDKAGWWIGQAALEGLCIALWAEERAKMPGEGE